MNVFLLGFPAVMTAAILIYRVARRHPAEPYRLLGLRVVTGGLLYAAIGPLIGLAVVPLVVKIPDSLQNLEGVWAAYLLGGLPALCCGMTAGALKRSAPSWPVFAAVCGAGALYGFVFMLQLTGVDRLRSISDSLQIGALPSLVAAIAGSLLFLGVRPKKAPATN
ncbi:hypothetical protein YH64_023660 [Achromobacter sp. LC458]|uniref:Uncharacterized protein n=1 Tax=Achromobacter spanius TaxID=217203 RepID=A0A2S5GIJ2_9BURK|nr:MULTISPECIES: hypothetical protein [Achromobacter]MDX3984650.1 hypothetical protein [Achromobacter sp.]PPA72725.1 hypothetical protein C4E15_29095 [Achromobacter spanius]TRM50552.1 hypothetical protein YH64_023660 [Achromobacter sp. LC458]